MNDSYEFYTEKEIEMIDNMKKISGDTMDDEEIYDIIVKHNFIESKVKNEVLDIIDKLRKKGDEYEWNVVQKGKEKAELKKQPNNYTITKIEKNANFKGNFREKEEKFNNYTRKEPRQNRKYYEKNPKTTKNYRRFKNEDFYYQEKVGKEEEFYKENYNNIDNYIEDKLFTPAPVDDENKPNREYKKQEIFETKDGVKTTVRSLLNDESVEVRIDKKAVSKKPKQEQQSGKDETNEFREPQDNTNTNEVISKKDTSKRKEKEKEAPKTKADEIDNNNKQSLNKQNIDKALESTSKSNLINVSSTGKFNDAIVDNSNSQDNDNNIQDENLENMVMSTLNIENEIKNASIIESKVTYHANNNSKQSPLIIPQTNNNNINFTVNSNIPSKQMVFGNLQTETQYNSHTEFKGKSKPLVINQFENLYPPWKSSFHSLKPSSIDQITYPGKGNIVIEWLQSNFNYFYLYKFFLSMQQDQMNHYYNHMMNTPQDINNPSSINPMSNVNQNTNMNISMPLNNDQGVNMSNMVNMTSNNNMSNNMSNSQNQGINQMYNMSQQLGYQSNQGFMRGNQMNTNNNNKKNIPKTNNK